MLMTLFNQKLRNTVPSSIHIKDPPENIVPWESHSFRRKGAPRDGGLQENSVCGGHATVDRDYMII